jgi:chemotaxis protein methyltransferase CheR
MSISSGDFEYIRALVRERAAIVLQPDKQYLVEARLQALASREGYASVADLVARLRTAPAEELSRKVTEAMTTNETMFFRDGHPFETLRRIIIPELIKLRAERRTLDIWCGAASTGQEPYSLIMLLREHFPLLAQWTVRVVATDISAEVLARARSGIYNQLEVNRGLPPALLQKYFRRQGSGWQINADVRRAVEFREMNLCRPWPAMPEMDLIFLRNVLIYFDVDTKKAILGRVRRQLSEDGYLFVGSSETTINLDDAFFPVMYDRTVCYRLSGGPPHAR